MLTEIALPAGPGGLKILCLFIAMIYLTALLVGRRLDFLADSHLMSAGIASEMACLFFRMNFLAKTHVDFGYKRRSEAIELDEKSDQNPISIMHITNNHIKLFYVYYANFKLLDFRQKMTQ